MTPYGDINLGQHLLGTGLSPDGTKLLPKPMSMFLKLQPHIPGPNELRPIGFSNDVSKQSIQYESEGWGFESLSGWDIFCLKNVDTFTRTSARVSKMNADARAHSTFQILPLFK